MQQQNTDYRVCYSLPDRSQNAGHALQLWEMNGTNVAATLDLPNRGAEWQSVNGHPFATR
jgi:hypothetical protein